MSSVADDLRRRTIARVLELSVGERVRLALSLGDDDVALHARVAGITQHEAYLRLRVQRRRGRLPSRAAAADAR